MTITNDKLRSLFLAMLMVFSVFAGTVALSGTAAAANVDPAVEQAVENNDGDITVTFNTGVQNASDNDPLVDGDGTSEYLTLYIREAGTEDYTDHDLESNGDIDTINDEVIEGDDLTQFRITSDAHGVDLDPADEVKLEVNKVQARTADSSSSEHTEDLGNVSIDVSSADVTETGDTYNERGDAQRVYQGEPVFIQADTTNAYDAENVLIRNVDEGVTLLDGSTGANANAFVYDTADLQSGDTYRVTFGPDQDDSSERYFNITDLRLSASLEDDGEMFDDDEDAWANVSASAVRGQLTDGESAGLAIEVEGPADADDDEKDNRYENPQMGSLGEFDEDYQYSDLDAGNYSVTVTDTATGIEVDTGSFSVDEAPTASSAEFDSTIIEEDRGDVAEIPISLSDSDEEAKATVSLGSKADDTNYVANVTVADNNGDGEVVLEFNSYAAGTGVQDRVFNATDGDEVVDMHSEEGAFIEDLRTSYLENLRDNNEDMGDEDAWEHDDVEPDISQEDIDEGNAVESDWIGFAREATIDAGDYEIRVAAHNSDNSDAERNFSADGYEADDVGSLNLSPRATESSTVWVGPESANDKADLAFIEENTDFNITQSSQAAMGEVIIHEISATGLEGAIQNRTDHGDVSVTQAFLAEESNATPDQRKPLWSSAFTEANVPKNRDAETIDLGDGDNAQIVPNYENDTYYVALKLSDVENDLSDGTLYNASFQINQYDSIGPLVGGSGAGAVDSEWTYQDATASLSDNTRADDDAIVVRKDDGQTFRGETNVAPGTELRLRIDAGDATESPFVTSEYTHVTENRTFEFETDVLEDKSEGINFSIAVERNSDSEELIDSTDTRLKETATASLDFSNQSVAEENQEVRVGSVMLSDGGFIVIENESGDVMGTSQYLEADEYDNVRVDLDSAIDSEEELTAVAYIDDNSNNRFDGMETDAAFTVDNETVSESASVSVSQEPSTFEVSGLSPAQATVTQGDSLSVSATVENTGGAEGTQSVSLLIGGEEIESQDVTLSAGESTTAEFTGIDTSAQRVGATTHAVASENDEATGALGIEANESSTDAPTDDPTDDPTDEPTDTPTDEPTDEPMDTPTDAPETTTDGSGPGFGVVAAIIALLGAALVAARRRE